MFGSTVVTIGAAVLFALLAVWLALEPSARLRFRHAAGVGIARLMQPLGIDPSVIAYLSASGQGREGIGKRSLHGSSKRSRYFRGVRRLLQEVGFTAAFSALVRPGRALQFAFPIAGGAPTMQEQRFDVPAFHIGGDGDDPLADTTLTEDEKKQLKELGGQAEELRSKLMERLGEMVKKGVDGEDKAEVEKREKELAEKVDKLIPLMQKAESTELQDFKADLVERLERFEEQMKEIGRRPVGTAKGAGQVVSKEDAYPGENIFLDKLSAAKGDLEARDRVREYEEKFASPERIKAWASGELEEVDLILPDIQQALPFLRAQAKIVQLFREIRTGSPSVEFPVWKSGLTVGHVKEGEPKPESDPTWDLEVARVFTIAGISDIPNPLLEDFPAARGWVTTELGSATGAQEERDVLTGDGVGEPLGLWVNEEIPTREVDATEKASLGRNLITSIFRGAQQVRINGFTEPTDVGLNPAVWTDIALSFEDAIGFLYGPPVSSTAGAPAEQPPARIMGLPVTWSSYVPLDEGEGEDETSVVVGNYQDGIVLRRSPFRIDVDTSVGFKTNETSFRGEERMGFIVVRPKSFVRVTGITPSPVE